MHRHIRKSPKGNMRHGKYSELKADPDVLRRPA